MAVLDRSEKLVGRMVAVLIIVLLLVLAPGPIHDWLNAVLRSFGIE